MKRTRARRMPANQALARAMKSARERGHLSWHYVAGFISTEHPSLSEEIEAFERARADALWPVGSAA
jgi:sirohydrochlorin ferrochelatase